MRPLGWLSMLFLLLSGCGVSAPVAIGAAVNTALAVGVSGARRARGGCYTTCDHGTECDHDTGLCEPLPCAGECEIGEVCITRGLRSWCETALPGEEASNADGEEAGGEATGDRTAAEGW
jgi:hypothetical protein